MKIALYCDNTLGINLDALTSLMNSICSKVSFEMGKAQFRICDIQVENPETYLSFSDALKREMSEFDLVLLGTTIPYDNNYFFDGHSNQRIISFSNWQILTDLPIVNGFAYFAASILARELQLGDVHEKNTGCIRDFWGDKRGVDSGMRSAFLCRYCKDIPTENDEYINDIEAILDLVANSSRKGEDILAHSASKQTIKNDKPTYDVFISHNSADKPELRGLVTKLKAAGITTWFDEEQLKPGTPWQPQLEKQIEEVRAAAVFVGDSGFGPWHDFEMRAFLNEFLNRGCPVIPVILPTAKKVPELPIFLKQMMWIDMRGSSEEGLLRLVAALSS